MASRDWLGTGGALELDEWSSCIWTCQSVSYLDSYRHRFRANKKQAIHACSSEETSVPKTCWNTQVVKVQRTSQSTALHCTARRSCSVKDPWFFHQSEWSANLFAKTASCVTHQGGRNRTFRLHAHRYRDSQNHTGRSALGWLLRDTSHGTPLLPPTCMWPKTLMWLQKLSESHGAVI